LSRVLINRANGLIRTLLVSSTGLEQAKQLISSYKQNKISDMNAELWRAKKVVDSTLHPGTR
jgi:Tricarboxylate carrier.